MKKILYIFILLFALAACQATQDALTLKKKNSADEFLVEKKSPLVLPPNYGDLPLPNEENVKEQSEEIKVSLGDDEHTVYVFGSEYRRIIINGIEFTDYFEIDEKQSLLQYGEKFFGIWRENDRQTNEIDVKILNNDRQ